MIKSMTGFGAAEGSFGDARISVEIRAVNHRFFNPSVKLPGPLSRWEADVREALKQWCARGHVTLTARLERSSPDALALDEARFGAYAQQLAALGERYGLTGGIDVATIMRLPDVLTTRSAELADSSDPARSDSDQGGSVAELLGVVAEAAASLDLMRRVEGARAEQYLLEHLGLVGAALDRIERRAPARLIEQRDRLRQSVAELTQGVAVDPQRLAQEIAIMADRLDISEELSRFRAHIDAFRATLGDSGDGGVGKRLGFLLQEMLREANTTGSKAADAGILADVVMIKEELERLREQSENVE